MLRLNRPLVFSHLLTYALWLKVRKGTFKEKPLILEKVRKTKELLSHSIALSETILPSNALVICKTHLLTPGNGASLYRCESYILIPWRTFRHRKWHTITFHRRTFESNIWHTISWKWLANDAHLRNTSAWRKWRSHWHTKWRNVVKWLTMTHIRVSIVTDILRPWRYCASRFWGTWRNHDAPFPGVKRWVLQMTSA